MIQYILHFVLKIMHGWGAVNFRICLAPKYHGYSISAHSYELRHHLAQLDNLDFTLSPSGCVTEKDILIWLGLVSFRRLLS